MARLHKSTTTSTQPTRVEEETSYLTSSSSSETHFSQHRLLVSVTIGAVITNCTEISQPHKLDNDTIERFIITTHSHNTSRRRPQGYVTFFFHTVPSPAAGKPDDAANEFSINPPKEIEVVVD